MFKILTKKDKHMGLEREIDKVISDLSTLKKDSDEYDATLSILERLATLDGKIKKSDKEKLSRDTIALVVGNLLGIVLILNYEKTDIIRTKALGFVMRGRV
jgi:hypothetical protein